jgi:hypothetical protein
MKRNINTAYLGDLLQDSDILFFQETGCLEILIGKGNSAMMEMSMVSRILRY